MQHRDHKARRHLTRVTLHYAPLSTLVTSMPDVRAPPYPSQHTLYCAYPASQLSTHFCKPRKQLPIHIPHIPSRQAWTPSPVKESIIIYVVTHFPSIYSPKLSSFLSISTIWTLTLNITSIISSQVNNYRKGIPLFPAMVFFYKEGIRTAPVCWPPPLAMQWLFIMITLHPCNHHQGWMVVNMSSGGVCCGCLILEKKKGVQFSFSLALNVLTISFSWRRGGNQGLAYCKPLFHLDQHLSASSFPELQNHSCQKRPLRS